jgi:hypothetical protein
MRNKTDLINELNAEAAGLQPQEPKTEILICLMGEVHGLKMIVRSLAAFGKVQIEDYRDDSSFDSLAKLKFTPYHAE